jgi:hypothetical protein
MQAAIHQITTQFRELPLYANFTAPADAAGLRTDPVTGKVCKRPPVFRKVSPLVFYRVDEISGQTYGHAHNVRNVKQVVQELDL